MRDHLTMSKVYAQCLWYTKDRGMELINSSDKLNKWSL